MNPNLKIVEPIYYPTIITMIDVINCIKSHLLPQEQIVLSHTCKWIFKLAHNKMDYCRDIINVCVGNNDAAVVEYFVDQCAIIVRNINLFNAVLCGNIGIIKFLLQYCEPFDKLWIALAAHKCDDIGNYIKLIDFMFEILPPPYAFIHNTTKKYNDELEIFMYELHPYLDHVQSLECIIALFGNLVLLKRFDLSDHKNTICSGEYDWMIVECAAMSGNVELLEHLKAENVEYYGIFNGINAVLSGNLTAVKYIYKNFSDDLNHGENLRVAFINEYFDIADYVLGTGTSLKNIARDELSPAQLEWVRLRNLI